jgi:hypothetical protein
MSGQTDGGAAGAVFANDCSAAPRKTNSVVVEHPTCMHALRAVRVARA